MWEEVDPADYQVRGLLIVHRTGWPKGVQNIRVTYDAGYAEDEAPDDLMDLVIELVRGKRMTGALSESGIKSETYGGYSYTKFDSADISDGGKSVIEYWRAKRPVIA